MKTRDQIDAELARLDRRLKDLPEECHPDEILEAFAGEAECLIEHAPPDQVEHIHATIGCMLAVAGLIPGDNESEECTAP
jgi:hypothetical protein